MGDKAMAKSGKGEDKNNAPTSKALEFCAGNMTIPAPGILSVFQGAMATWNVTERTDVSVLKFDVISWTDHLIFE